MHIHNFEMSKTLILSLFIALVLLSYSPTTNSLEVGNKSEYNYDVNSMKGPSHWGDLSPNWRLCNTGTTQSPIDIVNKKSVVVSSLGELRRVYKPATSVIVAHDHAIELKWEGDAGYIEINGTEYSLKQCHWHSPSEHAIDGKRFDVEVHLVHKSKNDKTAVVGILYEAGHPDSFLSMLSGHIKIIANTKDEEVPVGVVDPRKLDIVSSQYYRYIGSLTTPPCTQDVVWTVFRKVQPISCLQVKLLRDAVLDVDENNARPIQPINSRDLQFNM